MDRFGALAALLVFSGIQAVALVLYALVGSLPALYSVSVLFGVGYGGIAMCYPVIVREHLPAAESGRRLGLVLLFGAIGMALGGGIGGYLFDVTGSYTPAFLTGVAFNALNLIIVFSLVYRLTNEFNLYLKTLPSQPWHDESSPEYLPRRLPLVWLGMLVSLSKITLDLLDQLPNAAKTPFSHYIASQVGKESLDQVQPRARRGCEVHVKSRVLFQPRLDLGVLVGAVVIRDQVDVQILGCFAVDLLEKAQTPRECACPRYD